MFPRWAGFPGHGYAVQRLLACKSEADSVLALLWCRHPELKLKTPAQVFCMSWCPDFGFRGTQVLRVALLHPVLALAYRRGGLAGLLQEMQ